VKYVEKGLPSIFDWFVCAWRKKKANKLIKTYAKPIKLLRVVTSIIENVKKFFIQIELEIRLINQYDPCLIFNFEKTCKEKAMKVVTFREFV
jgi:hypothetical protein